LRLTSNNAHRLPPLRPAGRSGGDAALQGRLGEIGNDFKAELRRVIAMAGANPNRFHPLKPAFHRANLKRFPYHFIYRQIPEGIRVSLVRHHRRHPDAGTDRQ
jgi:hypothetical protein